MCAHHAPAGVPSERELVTALGHETWQIRLPMAGNPLGYVNGYLLADDDGYTLVDCGWKADDVLDALHAGLAACGARLRDVVRLCVTHFHFDHYGLAGTLRRAGVPELLMHARDWQLAARLIDAPDADARADAWIARNGFALATTLDDDVQYHRTERAQPTRELDDGERVGRLRAIWTPGHSPGHLCFVDERSGRMLTGDHVLDPVTPHVGVWHAAHGDPLGDYIASLRKVRTIGATSVLPAHGEPFADLTARADALLAHEATREAHIVTVLERGAASAGTVARALPWTRRERRFDELAPAHQQFAVAETIAHLEHLRLRDAVRTTDDGRTIVYASVKRA